MTPTPNPVLSIVVVIVSDTAGPRRATRLQECLTALEAQEDAPPFEVIVPHLGDVEGLEAVMRRFPSVRFLSEPDVSAPPGGREHHDVLRARGLAAARGDLVGLLEDHARPHPRWCASISAAHRSRHAGVGGAIENAIDRPLNWAVYYCDFGKYQNPVPAGETRFASDANVSYKRAALETVRSSWASAFREVVVNGALRARGESLALDPAVVVYQCRRGLTWGQAMRERFCWGRSYAATRRAQLPGVTCVAYAAFSPVLPVVLLCRMAAVARRRHSFARFLRALPMTTVLLAAWSAGEGVGYLRGVPSGLQVVGHAPAQ